jgi:HEAT repeat protein
VPDAQAIAPLLKTVNTGSENVDVRIAAAEALRHYRSLEVARTLVNLLGERDFGLAWQARQSLRFMTSADQRYDQTAWLNYLSQISWQ